MKTITNQNDTDKYYIGIDAGAVSINCVVVNQDKKILFVSEYQRHLGKVEEVINLLLNKLYNRFENNRIMAIAFTGNHGQKIAESTECYYEFETISQVTGALLLYPNAKTIISMGGQDTAIFQIEYVDGTWELEYFNTNGPCASGTGSFIDQQAQRLATAIYDTNSEVSQTNIDNILNDFIRLGLKSNKPSNVACRCTVFTKSDMIHLQNKGERLEDIIYGLHIGNARNYMSTIVSNRILEDPILFIGGLSMNELQVRVFKQYFSKLIVPENSASIGALGVALCAHEANVENLRYDGEIKINIESPNKENVTSENNEIIPTTQRLMLEKTYFSIDNIIGPIKIKRNMPVYLGIDIGSTTTKYALIDENGKIIDKAYVHTRGKPIEVTQQLFENLKKKFGKTVNILGTATTGSGRNVVGDFINADLVVDEITAHARGAIEIDPDIDTIFEIGGQDSKYIYMSNTYPLDFDMNKVCAAGTGSFLHELANKYGINIVDEFQKIALSSESPVKLAERCTVFMESDLISYHQKGVKENDLIAGLCYAVVYNYLNRVVGKRKIGKKVMFLGGPSLNQGVVAAFENILGRGLVVPKHREVLGAFGVATIIRENMITANNPKSAFRGLNSAIQDRMDFKEKTCHADSDCQNQCKLKIYDFDGRRSVWGGECGRYELIRGKGKKTGNHFHLRDTIWQNYMIGMYEELRSDPILKRMENQQLECRDHFIPCSRG